MAPKIQRERATRIIIEAVGEYASIREARIAGCKIHRERDEVIELCLPYAPPIVGKLMKLPGASRVDKQDLESAAALGICEGVDSFEHRKGVLITTHIWWRIFKQIQEERLMSHWTIMKPPDNLMREYMRGDMTEREQDAYINQFVRPVDSRVIGEGDIENSRSRWGV